MKQEKRGNHLCTVDRLLIEVADLSMNPVKWTKSRDFVLHQETFCACAPETFLPVGLPVLLDQFIP